MSASRRGIGQPLILRIAAATVIVCFWELIARSGLFYAGVVPDLIDIVTAFSVVAAPDFLSHVGITLMELALSITIGGLSGIAVGILLGGRSAFAGAFQPLLYYLAPTPKIVFLPIFFALFGVYLGPKIAVGALSAFFPIAMSVAAGRRDMNTTYLKVMDSFGASGRQKLFKAVLPALLLPTITGIRLGIGLAIVGVLLAETKISNAGVGFLAMQSYERFDIPRLYAILILVFVFCGIMNALLHWAETRASRK